MNKRDIVQALHERIGFSKRETAVIVDSALEEMRTALEHGETVTISAFGTFTVKARKSQKARNLKTGEPMTLAPRKTVTFKASPVLKDRVNDAP